MVQNPPTFSAEWASAAAKYLGCRAKARSQPHLSCVSHPSGAVVGHEVGNPHSRTHRWVCSRLERVRRLCFNNLYRTTNSRSLGSAASPRLLCKQLIAGGLKNGGFDPLRMNLLKTLVLPSPYPVPRACQEQTHLQGSHIDTSFPSVTAAGSSIRAAENPRSSIQREVPGSAAQPLALVPSSVAPAWGRSPGPSTERRLTPSHLASESTAAGELG